MNISKFWFAFALLIAAFGVGYSLGYYNTDKVTPLGKSGDTSSFTLKKGGNTYWCNAMSCWELTGFKNNSYDTEQGYPLYEYEE